MQVVGHGARGKRVPAPPARGAAASPSMRAKAEAFPRAQSMKKSGAARNVWREGEAAGAGAAAAALRRRRSAGAAGLWCARGAGARPPHPAAEPVPSDAVDPDAIVFDDGAPVPEVSPVDERVWGRAVARWAAMKARPAFSGGAEADGRQAGKAAGAKAGARPAGDAGVTLDFSGTFAPHTATTATTAAFHSPTAAPQPAPEDAAGAVPEECDAAPLPPRPGEAGAAPSAPAPAPGPASDPAAEGEPLAGSARAPPRRGEASASQMLPAQRSARTAASPAAAKKGKDDKRARSAPRRGRGARARRAAQPPAQASRKAGAPARAGGGTAVPDTRSPSPASGGAGRKVRPATASVAGRAGPQWHPPHAEPAPAPATKESLAAGREEGGDTFARLGLKRPGARPVEGGGRGAVWVDTSSGEEGGDAKARAGRAAPPEDASDDELSGDGAAAEASRQRGPSPAAAQPAAGRATVASTAGRWAEAEELVQKIARDCSELFSSSDDEEPVPAQRAARAKKKHAPPPPPPPPPPAAKQANLSPPSQPQEVPMSPPEPKAAADASQAAPVAEAAQRASAEPHLRAAGRAFLRRRVDGDAPSAPAAPDSHAVPGVWDPCEVPAGGKGVGFARDRTAALGLLLRKQHEVAATKYSALIASLRAALPRAPPPQRGGGGSAPPYVATADDRETFAALLFNKALCLYRLGEYRAALRDATAAGELCVGPVAAKAGILAARCLMLTGSLRQAKTVLLHIAQTCPAYDAATTDALQLQQRLAAYAQGMKERRYSDALAALSSVPEEQFALPIQILMAEAMVRVDTAAAATLITSLLDSQEGVPERRGPCYRELTLLRAKAVFFTGQDCISVSAARQIAESVVEDAAAALRVAQNTKDTAVNDAVPSHALGSAVAALELGPPAQLGSGGGGGGHASGQVESLLAHNLAAYKQLHQKASALLLQMNRYEKLRSEATMAIAGKKFTQAYETLKHMLTIDADNKKLRAAAHSMMGSVAITSKRFGAAAEDYAAALREDPNNAQRQKWLLALCKAYRELDEIEKAIAYCEEAQRADGSEAVGEVLAALRVKRDEQREKQKQQQQQQQQQHRRGSHRIPLDDDDDDGFSRYARAYMNKNAARRRADADCHYRTLNSAPGDTPDKIASAYRRLARKWHPDKWVASPPEDQATAAANFKRVMDAYAVLSDGKQRLKYDTVHGRSRGATPAASPPPANTAKGRQGEQRGQERKGPRAANPNKRKERKAAREDARAAEAATVVCWSEEWLIDSDTQTEALIQSKGGDPQPPKRKARKGRGQRGDGDAKSTTGRRPSDHAQRLSPLSRDVIVDLYDLEVWDEEAPRVQQQQQQQQQAPARKEKRREKKQGRLRGAVPPPRDALVSAVGAAPALPRQPPPPVTVDGGTETQTDAVWLTWRDIGAAGRDGQTLVVLAGHVYDVSSFLDLHPGGRAMLEAYRGLDVTRLFEVFRHPPQTAHLLHRMWVGALAPGEAAAARGTGKPQAPKPRRASGAEEAGGSAEDGDDEEEWVLRYDGGAPDFVLTVGIPGSGKSTWVKQQVQDEGDPSGRGGTVVVSTDAIRLELTGSVAFTNIEGEVWAVARSRITEALLDGRTTILDATNTISRHRVALCHGLPPCTPLAKIFHALPEEACRRIDADIARGVPRSDVPHDVVRKMHEQFTRDLPLLHADGFGII